MTFSASSLSGAIPLALLAGLSLGAARAAEPQSVDAGRALFEAQCTACHSPGSDRLIGPGLAGLAQRRDRAWLVAFITRPDRMIAASDSIATRLLEEYQVPMPNLALSEAQAESILEYLAEAEAPAALPPPTPLPSGDPARGRELFTGGRRLENGGATCISCHSVAGLGSMGGGTLAKDLTAAAATYGSGLPQVLATTPFPVMKDIFAARPLTTDEIADLSAFLAEVGQQEELAGPRLPFPAAGFGGMVLLAALAGLLWRGRLRGVRKPLIGERQ